MTPGPVIPDATQREGIVDGEFLDNPSIHPDGETMARLFVSTPCPQIIQLVVTRVWTRVKTGR